MSWSHDDDDVECCCCRCTEHNTNNWKPRAQNKNRLGQNGQGGLAGLGRLNLWPRLRGRPRPATGLLALVLVLVLVG